MNRFDGQLWQQFLRLAKPYWYSEEKWKARGLLAILLLLLLLVSGINVTISYVNRDYMTALSNKDASKYFHLLFVYGGVFAIATPIVVFYRYVRKQLSLYWRDWLTTYFLDRYFCNRAYYQIHENRSIDNPDQRISEDIRSFTQESLEYLLILLNAGIDLIAFIGILWSISIPLVSVLIIYAAVGTGMTVWFGKRLIGLNFNQLRREANFRYGLVRIRDNAESIAFYQGEQQESKQVKRQLMGVISNFNLLIGWERNLDFFTTGYRYLVVIVPSLVVAPLYFSGHVEFGVITQAIFAFRQVLDALSVIVDEFDKLSVFAAGINRLEGITEVLEKPTPIRKLETPCIDMTTGSYLALKHLTLQIPNSEKILVRDLSVTIQPGKGLLIVGHSGAGKSSLMRAIAGLWDSGTGSLIRPNLEEMLFLPQRPYMILGSLRTQLLYPSTHRNIANKELKKVLRQVNLEYLLDRVGGFDAELDWGDMLSVGEQQRLAFARLLLSSPRYAFLDEATSALDIKNEQNLYEHLQATNTTFISVGHRASLLKYHHYVLELKGDGDWRLVPVEAYAAGATSLA
ncbi:ABC transporter ATP-binding protein/permease [Microcoleus sp. FACHB-672]|uniref:ABC transporter ATP-binding protein/permease n=1 Tax=Microcoleus sp. FACHB-672 TaxID=2692825 RepID=UPI00168A2298|nr:ABC transporter ATP-binding protein/permease [Microcoleus sp. FACHB-672]MBD2040622.1 ABC transporter ATP-binding protein/permease [Microcoleus sp. FACHB-672]